MSAVPVIEPAIEPAISLRRPAPIVIELPKARLLGRQRVRPQLKASDLVTQAVGFCVLAGLSYGAIGLSGQVLVEKARRDSIRAAEQARIAARESATLRDGVLALTSARSIEEWASANGFIQAEGSVPATNRGVGGLVALHR